jgi:transcription initiation factor IIE alpha subunit
MAVDENMAHTCQQCSYRVSSGTANEFGPARRTYPNECRQCGGELVSVGGSS